MTNSKHTPAPWYFNGSDREQYGIYAEKKQPTVKVIARTDTASEQDKANARLISAAPELLEALERILRAHKSSNNGAYMGDAVLCKFFERMVEDAIAKARGRV